MATSICIIGSEGFVGSAIKETFSQNSNFKVFSVNRKNYQDMSKIEYDILIDCSGNSKKYLSDKDFEKEFQESVLKKIKILKDFRYSKHIHISSVDVYPMIHDTTFTVETADIIHNIKDLSKYGFHKYLAEEITKFYSDNWLIFRLSGMVGKNLVKNPVFDILSGRKIHIHPDSKYQFINTNVVSKIIYELSIEFEITNDIFNIAGSGLISPKQIAEVAKKELIFEREVIDQRPRIVDINTEKINNLFALPSTVETIKSFVGEFR